MKQHSVLVRTTSQSFRFNFIRSFGSSMSPKIAVPVSVLESTEDRIQASPPNFPFGRAVGAEPAVEYARLREEEPISRVKLWDNSEPYLVVKHKDITHVLTDDRLSKQR